MTSWKKFQEAHNAGKQTQQSQIKKSAPASKSPFQQYVEKQAEKQRSEEYSYPQKMTIPSTPGYYSFPHKYVEQEKTRLSNLIKEDNDRYERGVKNTIAPFYQRAMDTHRSQQSAYPGKGYPGLPGIGGTKEQQTVDLERYLEKTPEATAALDKYKREVLPYGIRASKTSKSAKEYEDSVTAAYDDWKQRVRRPDAIRKDIDALSENTDAESAAKRTLLEEELSYSQVFTFGDKYKSGKADMARLGDAVRSADSNIAKLQREIQDDQYILENWPGQQSGHTPSVDMVGAQGDVRERINANKDKLAGILNDKDIRKEEYVAYLAFTYKEMDEADADSKSIRSDVADKLKGIPGDVYNILSYLDNPTGTKKSVAGSVEVDGVDLDIGKLARMTDNERSMFVYLCNKGETDKAMTLLKDLTEVLPERYASDVAEAVDYPVLREAIALVNGTLLGLRDIGYGAASMFVDLDAPKVTDMEYMQQYWQEKHKGSLAGYTTIAAGTIGRMMPTVAATALDPAAAAMTTFLGSMGNSYAQARRDGFNHQQAWLYSATSGAAEAGLQAILGGAGGIIKGSLTEMAKTKVGKFLGKVASTKVGKLLGKAASNKVVKLAADFIGDIGGEILEENLQLCLEPAFKMLASMSDHYDSPSLDDVLETTIVTAISSAVFFGANQVSKYRADKAQVEYTKQVKKTMDAWSQMEDVPVLHDAAQALERHFAENDSITPREYNDIVNKYAVAIPHVRAAQAKHTETAKTETEQRADLVQAANPNATVIRSETVQAYIDTGTVTLPNAKKAAPVLDAIIKGDKTKLSDNEIDMLMLNTTAGAKVASKVLGVEIPRFADKDTARAPFRAIVNQYVQTHADSQNNVPVATEQSGGQIVPTYDEVSQNHASFANSEAYEGAPVAGAVIEGEIHSGVPDSEAMNGDLFAEGVSGVDFVTPDFGAEYNGAEQAVSQPRMGYTAFAEKYREYFNKGATDNELGTAYHRYSNPDEGGEYYGVRPSAEVFNLPVETVRAIDELGKLFGLDISFEDLGDDNGYYTTGTNKVVMDINPKRKDANSPFLFTASHELGHAIRDRIGAEAWSAFEKYAVAAMGGDKAVQAKQNQNAVYRNPTEAREDVACDFLGMLMSDKNTLNTFCKAVEKGQFNAEYAKGIGGLMQKIVDRINSTKLSKAIRKQWGKDIANAKSAAQAILKAAEAAKRSRQQEFYGANEVVSEAGLVKHSRKYDDQYMEKAERYNAKSKAVSDSVMAQARKDRAYVKARLAEMDRKGVILPADNEKGSKPFSNSSYGGVSEENTSICIRSLALEDLVNLVSEATGRPLTFEEQLYISQYVQTVPGMNAPECTYCYVAADRKSYREYLGEYIKQRDAVIEAYKNGETEYSFEGKYGTGLYEKFLNKRKNTEPMQKRFQEWISLVKSGKQLISPADVANLAKLDGDLTEFHKDLIPQIKDAMKYAQAASWAKKRIGFIAYNGHILKWRQSRIDALNSQFGLRMYSFSDFSPAFILENMQMFTDAAAKGLKVLAYTKELAFAKIFAPTGANINVSVFGFEKDGVVAENAMMGAPWEEAKALRSKYKNVGTVFVATSDNLVNWALEQDWIDVVIPFHLVRTGRTVAQIMDYMDYTDESSDTKEMDWDSDDGRVSGIYPTMHHNDKETYLAELKKNRLQPRFKRFLDNPNYMKLVNETRQSDLNTEHVQPIFDMEAADVALGQLELEGYYKPIGGTVDRMEQIALGLTEDISSGKAQAWAEQKKSEPKKNFGRNPKIKKSVKELDADYMFAVESGDMETAQRLVDEAAKKAGFSTEHLYHGTFDFGFTTIDTAQSDDNISFFVTNNPEVAQGYMPWYEDDASDKYHNAPRRIGKGIKQKAITNSSSIGDVVKVLNATFNNEYKNARAATDRETLDSFKLYHIPEMVESASKLINKNVPKKIKDLCRLIVEANERDTFADWANISKRYNEFDAVEIPYDPYDRANHIMWSRVVVNLQSISKMARTEAVWNNGNVIMKSALIDRYNTFLGGEAIGMHDFYGKHENQMVIQGEGSNWKSIPLGKHDAEYRMWLKETRGEYIPDDRPMRASTRDISEFAKYKGYRSVVLTDIYDAGVYGERGVLSDVFSYFYPQEDIKSADPVTYDNNGNVIPLSERFNPKKPDIRYSKKNYEEEYAPTFYSQMEKVVSGMKQEKFGASSVVSMLRGRGVKAEEIKWSGIETWLEGKKSVTKAELQEFIAGSTLQIEEDVLTSKKMPYSQEHLEQIAKYEAERDTIVENLKSEWKRIVGTDIPIVHFGAGLESSVVQNLLEANATKKGNTEVGRKYKEKRSALQRVIEDGDCFGFDNARQALSEAVRDPNGFMKSYEMTSFEESVFRDFVKAKEAYNEVEGISMQDQKALAAIAESADRFSNRILKIKSAHRADETKRRPKYGAYTIKGGTNYRELLFRIPDSTYSNGAMHAHWERSGVLAHARIQDIDTSLGKMLFIEEIQSDWHNEGRKTGYEGVPDAPFRDNYHEFVLKKLIRMAAEQDYDSIGWTTAEIQSERWSDEFAEGYRIEYDQDIPKFLNKYGKKWGAKVGKTVLSGGNSKFVTDSGRIFRTYIDALNAVVDEANEYMIETGVEYKIFDVTAKRDGNKITVVDNTGLELGTITKQSITEVWSMAITDSMKDSVLYEGQARYSKKDTGVESYEADSSTGVNHSTQNAKRNKGPFVVPTKAEADIIAARQAELDKERAKKRDALRDSVMNDLIRSVTGRSSKLSVKDEMKDLVDKHGAIPKGENPVRDVEVPTRTTSDTKVRRTVRTAMEAAVTPDSMIPLIEDRIIEGSFGYNPVTNKQRMQSAYEWVEDRDIGSALNEWLLDVGSGKLTADLSARGMLLYNNYVNASATETDADERKKAERNAADILAALSSLTTVGAQITQFNRMLKRLSPETQIYALERNVKKLQETINRELEALKRPKIALKLNSEWMDMWAKELRRGPLADSDFLYSIEGVIFADIAKQVPKRFIDKWNAWRYLSMLGNPKTLVRNTFGNALFMPAKALKDAIGTGLERIFVKDKTSRTKALRGDKDVKQFAKQDYKSSDVKRLIDTGNGKYSMENVSTRLEKAIRDAHKNFDAWGLRHWQKATDYIMNNAPVVSDSAFMSHHYETSFARIAKARGITAKMLSDGAVNQETLDKMRAYAANEALKATYKDVNAISEFMSKLKSKNKLINMALEGTIPFKSTPANVMVRAVEYSPIGFIESIWDYFAKVKKGEMSTSEFLDGISSNLSGTAIWVLGWLLASLGMIRIGADDDEKREGKQNYSLEIGDWSITLDWVAPASIPFFMGASMRAILGADDGASFLDAVMDATSTFFAPMLEMSMLSGMQDLLDTFTYGDGFSFGQMIMAFFVQPFFSYIGQLVPTILGQFTNTFEPNRTTTYVGDISGQVSKNVVRMIAKISEKIPFVDWRQMDYVDTFGRKEPNGTWYARVLNNFFNPAYVNQINVTDPDAEIRRLEEVTGEEISPKKPDYSITVSRYDAFGKKLSSEKIVLTAEQFEAYTTAHGQQYVLMMTEMMASTFYDTLSDEEKVEAISEIDQLAKEYGKISAGVGYRTSPGSSQHKILNLADKHRIPIAEIYGVKLYKDQLAKDDMLSAEDRKSKLVQMISGVSEWSEGQKSAVFSYVTAPETPSIGDHKPSSEQENSYADIYGKYASEVYESIVHSAQFASLSDEEKTAMIDSASDLISFYAKKEWATKYGIKSDSYDPKAASHKFDTLIKAGFSYFEAYAIKEKSDEISNNKDAYGGSADNQAYAFQYWLGKQGWNETKKQAAIDCYDSFWNLSKGSAEKYNELISLGFSDDLAKSVRDRVTSLPDGSNDQKKLTTAISTPGMTEGQKWAYVMNSLKGDSKSGTRKKFQNAKNAGFVCESYVKHYYGINALKGEDLDNNGKTDTNSRKKKVAYYIRNAYGLTEKQKNHLWIEQYPSESPGGWKTFGK